jgi:hypothetical protein
VSEPVTVQMPVELPRDWWRAVLDHPSTSMKGSSKDEEMTRLGWLLCAWDVLVEKATERR